MNEYLPGARSGEFVPHGCRLQIGRSQHLIYWSDVSLLTQTDMPILVMPFRTDGRERA
jgi:hypothetical protein